MLYSSTFLFVNEPTVCVCKSSPLAFAHRNGEGSWNYRLKFVVELPQKPEFLRLKFQLWDRDIFKWNDVIAEGSVDLYKWMLLAYHRKASVKPFKELKDARKKKEVMGELEQVQAHYQAKELAQLVEVR